MSEWLNADELAARGWPASCRVHRRARLEATQIRLGEHTTIEQGVDVEADELTIGPWSFLGEAARVRGGAIRFAQNCILFERAVVHGLRAVEIGAWSKIGPGCRLMAGSLRIGAEFWMNGGAEIGGGGWRNPAVAVAIGSRCHLGRNSHVNVAEPVTWGDDTAVGMDCVLATHAHWQPVTLGYDRKSGPITLGSDVAIYSRAVVSPGIAIADGGAVAAGAVVTADVPARTLVGGVPARALRTIQPPADLDAVVRAVLREVCGALWPGVPTEDRPAWFRIQPPRGEAIVYASEPYEADGVRVIQVTATDMPGGETRCVFDIARRSLDGFTSDTTEALRNALFRYGIRFSYRSYVRNRLDPKVLRDYGLA
jgi:acetyltransferase-like isoleucine patch superfamily enzyme